MSLCPRLWFMTIVESQRLCGRTWMKVVDLSFFFRLCSTHDFTQQLEQRLSNWCCVFVTIFFLDGHKKVRHTRPNRTTNHTVDNVPELSVKVGSDFFVYGVKFREGVRCVD